MTLVYIFAAVGFLHVLLDLAVLGFLWWYFWRSDKEREEMDEVMQEFEKAVDKSEKRPFAG
jgi:hypothetical protein